MKLTFTAAVIVIKLDFALCRRTQVYSGHSACSLNERTSEQVNVIPPRSLRDTLPNVNVHLGNICLLVSVVVYLKPEYKTCVAGRTPLVRKIFYYHKGTSRMTYGKNNFRPSFSDEILPKYLSHLTAADRAKVNSTCKQIVECLFDLALTSTLLYNTRIKVKHVICYV